MKSPLLATVLFFVFTPMAMAGAASRYSPESASIQDGLNNERYILTSGPNHADRTLPPIDPDNALPDDRVGRYTLINFSFKPEDLGLATVNGIVSSTLQLTTGLDERNGVEQQIELFFVSDGRQELGVVSNDDIIGYNTSYDSTTANGINPSQFTVPPVSLGTFDVGYSDFETLEVSFPLEFTGDAESNLINRINAGQDFHLLIGSTSEMTFATFQSFSGATPEVRPLLTLDGSGEAFPGAIKEPIRTGAIHIDGDTRNADFYGSGNDDTFAEYGIAGFQFAASDFGVPEVEDVASVSLTLTNSDRGFTDGDLVEFFFTPDTADDLGFTPELGYDITYDDTQVNGIDDGFYTTAPVSLGTYPFNPDGLGGNRTTFDLNFDGDAKAALLNSINSGSEFQLIIASPDATSDITFSGLNNAFDPGDPQLAIGLEATGGPTTCGDFDMDGDVDSADRTIQTTNWTGALPPGDPNANKTFAEGDCDGDGDVDTADQNGTITNWTGAMNPAGNLEDGDEADLVYDPASGNVKLDAGDTSSSMFISFVLGTGENNMRPENLTASAPGNAGPFFDVGTNTDATTFQIGQTDPLNQGAGPVIDLGDIFPAGIPSREALAEYLTLAEYASELGSGGTFDLKLVPEPSGLVLLLAGVLMFVRSRIDRP